MPPYFVVKVQIFQNYWCLYVRIYVNFLLFVLTHVLHLDVCGFGPVFLILLNFSISQKYGKNMTERAFIITFNY